MKQHVRDAAIFVCSATVVLTAIGEGISFFGARERAGQKAITAVVQQAVAAGDCNLASVRGHAFPYNGTGDAMGLHKMSGTISVGPALAGVEKGEDGTVVYRLNLRDNVSGKTSSPDVTTNLSENDPAPFGRISVTFPTCAAGNPTLAKN